VTETGAIVRLVLVDGHVQGVGYREFTRRAAMGLGVSGWVRNRYDGAVEALIRGPPPAVEALVAEMRQGPRFADVNGVSVSELDETPGDDGGAFVIRATA
jgi:acylphosphatase